MKASVLALPILALLLSVPPRAAENRSRHRPVELALNTHACFAPCDLRISVRIEPHLLNRWWVLEVDGGMFDSSAKQLDGDHSPATQPEIWYRELGPGNYDVVAVVYRQQEKSEAGRAHSALRVIGNEP